MRILITGGCGFIGSALIRYIINNTDYEVINVDKLTYAGNLESLSCISDHNNLFRISRTSIKAYVSLHSHK